MKNAQNKNEEWIYTVEEISFCDGWNIPIEKYVCDSLLKTKKGTFIPDEEMFSFLKEKGVKKIRVSDAVSMWETEKEKRYVNEITAADKRLKIVYNDDVQDVGHHQANENFNI